MMVLVKKEHIKGNVNRFSVDEFRCLYLNRKFEKRKRDDGKVNVHGYNTE